MTWYTTSTSNLPLQIGVSESGFFPLLDAESYTQEQASRKGKEAKYGYHVPEQPEYVLSTVRDRLLIIDWGGERWKDFGCVKLMISPVIDS